MMYYQKMVTIDVVFMCFNKLEFKLPKLSQSQHKTRGQVLFYILYVHCTHPRSEGNEFENGFESEAHCECEVHVREEIGQQQRRAVKLCKQIYKIIGLMICTAFISKIMFRVF